MTEWEIYFPSSTDRWKALPVNNVSRNMFPGVCRRKIVPELLWYSKVYFNLIHTASNSLAILDSFSHVLRFPCFFLPGFKSFADFFEPFSNKA